MVKKTTKWILNTVSSFDKFRVALYVRNTDVTYFDSFGVEHIPKETKVFIDRSLSITVNIFTIQAYDSIICQYFSIGFIDFMFAEKILTEFVNSFSPNNF